MSYFTKTLRERRQIALDNLNHKKSTNLSKCTFVEGFIKPGKKSLSKKRREAREFMRPAFEQVIGEKRPSEDWVLATVCNCNDKQCINTAHAYYYHKELDKSELKEMFEKGEVTSEDIPDHFRMNSYLNAKDRGTHNTEQEYTCEYCGTVKVGPLAYAAHRKSCEKKHKKQLKLQNEEKKQVIDEFTTKLNEILVQEDTTTFLCKTYKLLKETLPDEQLKILEDSELTQVFKHKLLKQAKVIDDVKNEANKLISDAVKEINSLKTQIMILNTKKKDLEKELKRSNGQVKYVQKTLKTLTGVVGEPV